MNWPKVKLLAIRLAKVLGYNEKQAKELAAKLNLRRQVRAPAGYRLVAFDMKGFEARVIALLSGDPYMVQLFKEGRDIHAELSREWCPNFDSDVVVNGKLLPALSKDARDAVRDQTKRTEFGCFYEGSVQELWLDIVKDYPSVTLAMIAGVVRKMKQLMPRVSAWHREMENQVVKTGELRSMLGRRRCFPLHNVDPTVIGNHPVQATAADIMNGNMDRLDRMLAARAPDTEIIMQQHDQGVMMVPENDVGLVREIVTETCDTVVTHNGVSVRFAIDLKDGETWAEV